MSDLVAAVDGGGTKTQAVLADRQGALTFLPAVGGCNPQDGPGWHAVLGGVLSALAARRGLAAAVLGLPGYGERAEDDAAFAALAGAALAVPHRLLNDVELACRAAFPDGRGVLVLSGTGSMAMAEGPAGLARSGGWGDLFGDEGSAHWIGARALQMAAQEMDGRLPASGFAAALMARIGADLADPYAPLTHVLRASAPRAAIAAVARAVDGMAVAGDATARAILAAAAEELARAARAAAARAGLSAPAPWALAGSVGNSHLLRQDLAAALGTAPITPPADALAGGVILAAGLAGWEVSSGWRARVAAATRAWGGAPAPV